MYVVPLHANLYGMVPKEFAVVLRHCFHYGIASADCDVGGPHSSPTIIRVCSIIINLIYLSKRTVTIFVVCTVNKN